MKKKKEANRALTIIVPAYNEANGIGAFLDNLYRVVEENKEWNASIVVVDDGSTDDTAEVLKRYPHVTVLTHKQNRGYGAALKTGIAHCEDDFIAIIDADMSYKAEDIFRLAQYMERNDMVVGVRGRAGGGMEFFKRIARWIICTLSNFLTKRKIPDLNSGLRIMDRSVVEKFTFLLPDGFSFTSTITLAMLTNHYYVHYEPIDYLRRVGKSKISPAKDFSRFIYLILTTILCFHPIRIFFPVSVFFVGLAMFILFFTLFFTEKVWDITTVLIFLTGVNLFATGLVAELIVRLSKKR